MFSYMLLTQMGLQQLSQGTSPVLLRAGSGLICKGSLLAPDLLALHCCYLDKLSSHSESYFESSFSSVHSTRLTGVS